MKQKLEEIRSQALAALSEVSDVRELEALKVEYLGKKGKLTQILKVWANCRLRKDRS